MRCHPAARTLAEVANLTRATGDGKIRLPADLDAVTAIGEEDHAEIDSAAVERIWQAARHWYQAGMHPAIQLCIRRHGRVVLNRAIGYGWGSAPTDPPDAEKVPVTTDTPFCVYSAAKAITATVVHMLVERGHFSLDDRVCEYLPTYTSHGKDRTTIRHVMTHSAGVPFATGPRPDVTRADDHEYVQEMLGQLRPLYRPGSVHIYHALTWGPLMQLGVGLAPNQREQDSGRGEHGLLSIRPTVQLDESVRGRCERSVLCPQQGHVLRSVCSSFSGVRQQQWSPGSQRHNLWASKMTVAVSLT